MKEAYVKFGTAQRLKEKGFDWKCRCFYRETDTVPAPYFVNPEDNFNNPDECNEIGTVSAPTQQMACSWMMEEKHIFIGKSFAKNKETLNLEFHSPIFNIDTGELITTIGAFCPEDAVEAALEYCLTNMI